MGRPRQDSRTVIALYRGDTFIEVGEKNYILRKYNISKQHYQKRSSPNFMNNILPTIAKEYYKNLLIIVKWEERLDEMPDVHAEEWEKRRLKNG